MNINGPKGAVNPGVALAGAAVKKGHAVKRGADVEHVIHGTANAACVGIATDDQDTAEKGVAYAFRPGERVVATAGAAFAVDTLLKSDGTGKLIAATSGDNAIAISREAAGADLDMVCVEVLPQAVTNVLNGVGATAAGFKVARGQAVTVAASDTIVTGLTTVVSAVANLEDAPVIGCDRAQGVIGDQAGTPAAGSILLKTFKPTAAGDATPIAATTFGKKVNWIAIGT